MPQAIETLVYHIDELDVRARDAARDWYRLNAFDHDWYDSIFEDFEAICGILGVTLAIRPVKLYGGGTRYAPQILFSGFVSQGDGASFEGSYSYAKAAPVRIRQHAPLETGLHGIADALQTSQRRNFYQLEASIRRRGRYCHEYSMDIAAVRQGPTAQSMSADAEDVLIEAFRDLARWLYRQLESEYDHLNSAEAVDEAIRAADYTFTESGIRFG